MARTAVIAGVGPGLGESLARKFAAEGCQVALFARSQDYIEDLADDLPAPGEGLAVQTDLSDVDQIREGFAAVREAFGPVDILVNHASGGSWEGMEELSAEQFEQALDGDDGTVIFTGATSAAAGHRAFPPGSSPPAGSPSRWPESSAPRESTSPTSSSTAR